MILPFAAFFRDIVVALPQKFITAGDGNVYQLHVVFSRCV